MATIGRIGPSMLWVGVFLFGWILALAPVRAQSGDRATADGGWRTLFNGKDLSGWTELNGDHVFEAANGMIVGTTVPGQPNGFLTTDEEFGDFIVELEVKVDPLMNNSGIQFRSLSTADYNDYRVHGYQAEIDTKPQRWSGSIYDEARRGWLYIMELNPEAKHAFVNNAWNHYRIEAIGTTNRVWVNGVPTAHLVDDETTRGFIGLQLHANNPYDPPGSHQIRFRNIRIRTDDVEPSPLDDIFVVNLIPNHVSDQERNQGFRLLWDGETANGWTGISEENWGMENGALRPPEGGREKRVIASEEVFGAFELKFEFMPTGEGATCDVHYLANSDDVASEPSQYCRMASQKLEEGDWNRGVIRARPDGMVEYWLNGHLILEVRRDPQAPTAGHIVLASAGDVAYRSLKIRDLETPLEDVSFRVERDGDQIAVYRGDEGSPALVQNVRPSDRPYIHPIVAPDGNGVLTEYRPEHHPHQTGLYWGLKEVNGRDFFMGWQEEHYRRVSASVLTSEGPVVRWRAVYDLLDANGEEMLTETHVWSLRQRDDKMLLDLEWTGEAQTDLTVGEFYVGGLFLRMPWHEGVEGDAVNSAGRRNAEAEGQRAMWTDVGVAIDGRNDPGHIAIFDHPDNEAFPTPWRVDSQLGVGPSRQILGDWSLDEGESTTIRYRMVVYTGDRDHADLTREWVRYATGDQ